MRIVPSLIVSLLLFVDVTQAGRKKGSPNPVPRMYTRTKENIRTLLTSYEELAGEFASFCEFLKLAASSEQKPLKQAEALGVVFFIKQVCDMIPIGHYKPVLTAP